MTKRPRGLHDFHGAAGGWEALGALARQIKAQQISVQAPGTLLRANQPDGFDCPGCAWPDPEHTSAFEFCENGAKAIAWESTAKRASAEVFARHTVSDFWTWPDHAIEDCGRLVEPLRYEAVQDRFVPVGWDEAVAEIGARLQQVGDPNAVEFYTSGRASNEAAFLYQLFARRLGTNNFPDCSNMCHEPTSVGLPQSIGVGKGTVSLADFDQADLILSIGHNPGTNHPRMMTTLRAASRRGARIIVINPLRERALERFAAPQDPVEMATMTSTPIASEYHCVRIGGDAAAIKGVCKALLELDEAGRKNGSPVIDHDFIAGHAIGFESFADDLRATSWDAIVSGAGLSKGALEGVAQAYAAARATIVCYGMGITQHRTGTANVRLLVNLLLMRGNLGRPGAGICPLRGHSNVQGDRTMGVTERPSAEFLDRLGSVFGFAPPRRRGHSVVESIAAMRAGTSRAVICLGGNLAMAAPDPAACFEAFRNVDLSVHIATKLNRTHLLTARGATFVLPCLGRTERDVQAGGVQSVTVEDSMSMVHASRGFLVPPGPEVRSETAIIAALAQATLGGGGIDWTGLAADYGRIRDLIAQVFPEFEGFNARVRKPGGFKLPNPAAERIWKTPSGRAEFAAFAGIEEDVAVSDPQVLRLATLRSHDQYNTTIYSLDDRYRGVSGRRDLLFMNRSDAELRGLQEGDLVDVASAYPGEGPVRVVAGLTLALRDMPDGCCGAYYPESQPLVDLSHVDPESLTPSYKSLPVRVAPAAEVKEEGAVRVATSGVVGTRLPTATERRAS